MPHAHQAFPKRLNQGKPASWLRTSSTELVLPLVSGQRTPVDTLSKPLECLDFTCKACKGDSSVTRLFQNLNPSSPSVAISPKVAFLDKIYACVAKVLQFSPPIPSGQKSTASLDHTRRLTNLRAFHAFIHNQISPPMLSRFHECLL